MTEEAKRIAVIGSAIGGGAAQIIDALRGTDRIATAVFDKDERAQGQTIFGAPVVGASDMPTLRQHFDAGLFDAAVIAIGGDLKERERIFHALEQAQIPTTNVIDPTAQLRSGVKIGTGNVLLGGVYLGPGVEIGDNCYIISYAGIQHDSRIGDHSYFSTGAMLAGRVIVGARVRFDTRSGARANLAIGDDCVIGAGCVLTQDLPAGHRAEAAAPVVASL